MLYQNIIKTVPERCEYIIYLINNSPENVELGDHLTELAQRDEHRLHVHPERNEGFGAGHNLAIVRTNSDFHFLVNPDITIPDSDQIERLLSFMQDEEVVLCNPKILSENGEIQKLVKRSPTVLDMGLRFLGSKVWPSRQRWFVYDSEYDHAHESINLSGSFMVCKTRALQKIGGFDQRYFLYMEDADLTRSMSHEGKTMYFPDAIVKHDWQRSNRKSLHGILVMLNSMRKYFDKWGWKFW